ncbi:hypothetical protein [Nocardia neocaledoniensis]|uniref:hypothetical protein n=1 Tax=Nocardia neocaledoniensis TaxID=236511 RepID=UPI0011B48A6F|nr:hypothetical protein [Nocardia neocaledoniensis]
MDTIERWAAQVSSAARDRVVSRHIDEFGLIAEDLQDPGQLLASCARAFAALCKGVDWPNRVGVAAGLVLPLEETLVLPSQKSLRAGIDFLRGHLHRKEAPGLYLLPANYLNQWSDRDEDYRYPFDPRSVVDIPVDSAFVRYSRSAADLVNDDVYSAAIYLIRSAAATTRRC